MLIYLHNILLRLEYKPILLSTFLVKIVSSFTHQPHTHHGKISLSAQQALDIIWHIRLMKSWLRNQYKSTTSSISYFIAI